MKKHILLLIILFFANNTNIMACDFSQPDKIKHIAISKKTTIITRKVFEVPFIPLKPVKWLFNPTVQKIFPDNYVPSALAAVVVFTGTTLKEVPFDVIVPGRHPSYCDVMANCRGIKEGLK